MSQTFEKKVLELKKLFAAATPEQRYHLLIAMGRDLPPFNPDHKIPAHTVQGCQSTLYLHASFRDSKLFFSASADALISAGLAALLISVYTGETPETILKCPPTFLQDLGIAASLSMNRSNGLAHIHLRMKQEAVKYLI